MSVSQRAIGLSKISAESADSVNSAFDVYSTPHTHTSVMKGEWIAHPPVRDSDAGDIEYDIPPADDHYTDLAQTYLHLRVKVKKGNGGNLPETTNDVNVALGDNFFHSLFAAMTFKIAGQDVEYEPNYPFRAFFENLINYGADAKKTQMFISSGWREDTAVSKDYADWSNDDKTARKEAIAGSGELEFYGKLRLSMFAQDRFIPPGLRLQLSLRRSNASFCLSAAGDNPGDGARLSVVSSDLYVRRIQANPALQRAQTSKLMMGGQSIKLPIDRVKTHFHVVAQGIQHVRLNLDQNGQRPNRVFVALLSHSAKSGTYKKNPFKFAHHNVSSVELSIDGTPVARRYEPSYGDKRYAREYMNLFAVSGTAGTNTGNCIDYDTFADRNAIYAFDITGDLCDDDGVHLITNGSLTLKLSFSTATTEPLSVFIYEEKDEIISIDGNQQVSMVSGML